MNGADFSSKLLDEIKVVSQAQTLLEDKTKQDYTTYAKALKYVSQYVTHLWDLYYYYFNHSVMLVNSNLENSVTSLKNYNDKIDRSVKTLQQVNDIIVLVSDILKIAFGLTK